MKQEMTARQRYETLKILREPAIARAREAALLTIPALMVPEGHTGSETLYTPFQSVGARGVNNLAGKFLMALFPPTSSFFRLEPDAKVLDDLEREGGDAKGELQKALAKYEKRVTARLEQNGSRAPLNEALRQLINSGNVLLVAGKRGKLRYFPMSQYVVKRDGEGNVLDIVVLEKLARATLPEKVEAIVEAKTRNQEGNAETKDRNGENDIELYTRITRVADQWTIHQEVLDTKVPDSEGTYPLEKCPWIAARFSRIDGEDWGRGMVEEYIGDLTTLESLSKSTVEMAAQLARILYFVNPAGITTKDEVARALNGDVLEGDAKDITIMQLQKVAEFRATLEKEQSTERRLEQSFLLLTAVQRDAERVTAEEVRMVAGELEQAFGGVYSLFAEEIQLPLVRVLIASMTSEGALPSLPEKAVSPQIVTGAAALGRTGDAQKLITLAEQVTKLFGPEAAQEWLKVGPTIKRLAVAIGVDVDELVSTEDQVAQARQAKATQEAALTLGPEVIKQQNAQPNAAPQEAA